MIDSRCQDPGLSALASSKALSGSGKKSSKADGSMEIIDFAGINLFLHPSASEENIQSFPPSQKLDAKKSIRSLFEKSQAPKAQATVKPPVEPPVEQPAVQPATPPVAPAARGHLRARGYKSAGAINRDLKNPASPDRFIPIREFHDLPATPFHVNKSPHQLSPEEKLLRRRSPKADPFMPSRPRRSETVPKVQTGRTHSPHYAPHMVNDLSVVGDHALTGPSDFLRQISSGAVWNVGGIGGPGRPLLAIPDGTGGHLGSGTTAPMYTAKFLPQTTTTEERQKHETRVALALDIDPATRLLGTSRLWPLLESRPSPSLPNYERLSPLEWKDNAWKRVERDQWPTTVKDENKRVIPTRPFRVLDAPLLRDDFYCSTLAYSSTSGILAVGLGHRVYLWSEALGVQYPPFSDQHPSNYVTSLSFSSENGGKSILAVGRHTGLLCLWSIYDSDVRFEISHPNSISCVAFKQTKSRRLSERFSNMEVDAEDLAAGDELGNVWYYSVEWPYGCVRDKYHWNGTMTLLAKISAHTQQICGLAWSPDDIYIATGGNDNSCLLFELREIISPSELGCTTRFCQSRHSQGAQSQNAFSCLTANSSPERLFNRRHLISHLLPSWAYFHFKPMTSTLLNHTGSLISGGERTAMVPSNRQKHRLAHSAAVKAIAFAPWQPSLLATGGGSNDRAIHFYHTPSGACLATINVHAQVTSLIWSKTRREIAATFGFAQPEHPYRIAVFAWPSCEQIAAIPWGAHGSSWESLENEGIVDGGRALWAVSYPGTPHHDLIRDTFDDGRTNARQPTTIRGGLTRRGRSEPCRRTTASMVRPREKEGGLWCSRTVEEGCIIVASSDQSVKFHEVWSGLKKGTGATTGLFGGSEILEGLEGIEKPGREVIR